MPSINRVTLIGHAGGDAEMRFTQTGKKIMTFSLATGTKDRTEWHSIKSWDPPDWVQVNKGDLVFVDGKLTYESWEGKDGQRKYKAVVVGHVHNISGKSKPADDVPF